MKKIALVLVAGLSLASAKAQIQFGVKAGANLANLRISPKTDGLDLKSKIDFNGGAFVAIPLFSKFSLQPEAVYSGEGSKVEVSGGKGKYNVSFINVPVLFKYNDASGFFAETGPQVGFLLSAKAKEDGGDSEDIKDGFKSTNFSWALGVGYLIPDVNVGIDLRYNLGLANIAKGDSGDGSLKTGTFQFGVFYVFGGSAKAKK